MRAATAQEPIARIRRLYDAWNAGDVATAADVLSPDVRWDTFGAAKTAGPNAMQATLAAGSGGTWHLTAVSIDLLIGIGAHVLACSRRSGAAPERIEIWTLEHGKAVHYRGYPLDDGLAVLTETTGSRKLEIACRALLAFNRGDRSALAAHVRGRRARVRRPARREPARRRARARRDVRVARDRRGVPPRRAPSTRSTSCSRSATSTCAASSRTRRSTRRSRPPRAGARPKAGTGRQGWPRSAGHGGSGVGASIPATTGSTSRDGREAPRASVTRVFARGWISPKLHTGWSPRGAASVTRTREPAR